MAYELFLADIDYVTVPLHPEWLRRYNLEWNDNLEESVITEWAIHKFVKPECGKLIYNYLEEADLYDNIEISDEVCYYINEFKRLKFRVVFLTSGIHIGKYNILKRYGLVKSQEEMIIAKDKSLVYGDIMLDDYDVNIFSFYTRNRNGMGILYDAPHNQDANLLWRVSNWEQAFNLVIKAYR